MPTFRTRDTAKAKALRHAASPAGRRLWAHLSACKLGGFKFSRQMPLGPFVADFLCREHGLIVELDGCNHDVQLEGNGFTILRFANHVGREQVEGVLLTIAARLNVLADAQPRPLPPAGGAQS